MGPKASSDEESKILPIRFKILAELERHLIHARETLGAASNTMQLMMKDQNKRCPLGPKGQCEDHARANGYRPQYSLRQISPSLTMHFSILTNLKLRADGFEKRLQNEIGLVR